MRNTLKPILNKKSVFLLFILLLTLLSGIYIGSMSQNSLLSKYLFNFLKKNTSEQLYAGDDTLYPDSSSELCNWSTADIAEKVSDSVVTVSVKTVELDFGGGVDLFDYFGFVPSKPLSYKEVEQDIGTGFIVGVDKFVITNKHVVSDIEAAYKIIDENGKEYKVLNIYRDPVNDIAILNVDGLTLESIELGDSDKLRVGEDVIAIGTALGEFRHTVTTGVVSGLGRGITASDAFGESSEELTNVIQTDAAINPGNSGGPLINRCGQVIGVNVATSRGAENIGFAIPINTIKSSLDIFNDTGKFERPFLGIKYNVISEQAALRNEIPVGVYVVEVVENSSADDADIRVGDIIVEFDNVKLADSDLPDLVSKKKIGDKVTLRIYRWNDDTTLEKNVTLKASTL